MSGPKPVTLCSGAYKTRIGVKYGDVPKTEYILLLIGTIRSHFGLYFYMNLQTRPVFPELVDFFSVGAESISTPSLE